MEINLQAHTGNTSDLRCTSDFAANFVECKKRCISHESDGCLAWEAGVNCKVLNAGFRCKEVNFFGYDKQLGQH